MLFGLRHRRAQLGRHGKKRPLHAGALGGGGVSRGSFKGILGYSKGIIGFRVSGFRVGEAFGIAI